MPMPDTRLVLECKAGYVPRSNPFDLMLSGKVRGRGHQCHRVKVRASGLYARASMIDTVPSLGLETGAIRGVTLRQGGEPRVNLGDVRHHNALAEEAPGVAPRTVRKATREKRA